MPIKGFICPDRVKVTVEECLEKCRLASYFPTKRCRALPILKHAAREKEWNDLPSTTQLLTGTRELFLKVKSDYYINPDSKTFALIGVNTHGKLYNIIASSFAEETIVNDLLTGTYDFYDPESKTLFDYKTWGLTKVNMILQGNPEYRVNSMFDVVLQLNNYRMLLQGKYPSLPIHHLAVQVVNRESGLKKESLNWNTPVILIPVVEDKLIREFFKLKKQKVDLAFEINWAPKCSEEESWKGRKCKDYCDVSETCESYPEQEITDNWILLNGRENIVKKQIKEEIKEFITNNRQLQSDLF